RCTATTSDRHALEPPAFARRVGVQVQRLAATRHRRSRNRGDKAGIFPERIPLGRADVWSRLPEQRPGEHLAAAVHRAEPDLDVVRAGPTLRGLVDEPAGAGERGTLLGDRRAFGRYVDGAGVGFA